MSTPDDQKGLDNFVETDGKVWVAETDLKSGAVRLPGAIMQNVTLGRKEGGVGRGPRVGHGVLLSTGATVLGDICVGDFAKIGAGAVVREDVPAGCTAVGVPARLTNCPEADVPD